MQSLCWLLPDVYPQLNLSPELQTPESSCLLHISTWMSPRHLDLTLYKPELAVCTPRFAAPPAKYLRSCASFLSLSTSKLSGNPVGSINKITRMSQVLPPPSSHHGLHHHRLSPGLLALGFFCICSYIPSVFSTQAAREIPLNCQSDHFDPLIWTLQWFSFPSE